ncbi:hypothetical protein GCM10020254_07360 [Streptomyces goshikiensis]
MRSRAVCEDLRRDVRLGAEEVQVFELLAHDPGGTDGAVQHRFVQDGPQPEGTGRMVGAVLAP